MPSVRFPGGVRQNPRLGKKSSRCPHIKQRGARVLTPFKDCCRHHLRTRKSCPKFSVNCACFAICSRYVSFGMTASVSAATPQVTLLEESWKDLFLLYMAQWSVAADLMSSLPGLKGGHSPSPPTSAAAALRLHPSSLDAALDGSPQHAAELHYIQDVMRRLRQLSPDDTECSCLKAVVLFKPGTPHWFEGFSFFMLPHLHTGYHLFLYKKKQISLLLLLCCGNYRLGNPAGEATLRHYNRTASFLLLI